MGSKILKRRISGSRSSMGVPARTVAQMINIRDAKSHFRRASTEPADGRRASVGRPRTVDLHDALAALGMRDSDRVFLQRERGNVRGEP